jgi:hypothetical protein
MEKRSDQINFVNLLFILVTNTRHPTGLIFRTYVERKHLERETSSFDVLFDFVFEALAVVILACHSMSLIYDSIMASQPAPRSTSPRHS